MEKNLTNDDILVSIVVITYNSSKYILETLESIKAQIYNKIELIISDDCSTDNTLDICQKWIDENRERFLRAKMVYASKNTGVTSNCNRGINEAKGIWIKLIAGDDFLAESCIRDNIDYISSNPKAKFVFSNVYIIDEDSTIIDKRSDLKNSFFKKDASSQHALLVINNRVNTISSFFNKDAYYSIGGYDNEIRNTEDYVLWLRATSNKYKLYYFNKYTVFYRKHEESISYNLFYEKNIIDMEKIFYKYKVENINFKNILYIWEEYLRILSIKNKIYSYLRFLSPLYVYRKILK